MSPIPHADSHAAAHDASLRTLEHLLLAAIFIALVAIASLPAARAASPALGWVPLWLLGLPAASLAMARVLACSRRGTRSPRPEAPVLRRRRPLRQAARRAPQRRRMSRLLAALVLR